MKRLVLFVEGDGEIDAVPILIGKLLTAINAWDSVFVDPKPFRVGEISKLAKDNCKVWLRLLEASLKRTNVGGVLLILDGDAYKVNGAQFCASQVACQLAAEAKKVGGGATFSVAVVFACQEYESWLIAGIQSVAGCELCDGRQIAANAQPPEGDLEKSPRDAKGFLSKIISHGYKPTRDQAELTAMVDLSIVRSNGLRSFRRLESAVSELVSAIRSSQHVATPS